MDVDKKNTLSLTKVLESLNPWLFYGPCGESMSFHCVVSSREKHFAVTIEQVINAYGGEYITSYQGMSPHTVLLVTDDGFKKGPFNRPTICLTYIGDCIHTNTLLDINDYCHPWEDRQKWNIHDLFEVVYRRTMKFQSSVVSSEKVATIVKAKTSKIQPAMMEEEDSDEDYIFPSLEIEQPTRRGRGPVDKYRSSEKVAILKWLVNNKKYHGLRGDPVWKMMERKKVCPGRTWQSMKNHFLKTLLKELDRYDFVPCRQKQLFLKPSLQESDEDSAVFD